MEKPHMDVICGTTYVCMTNSLCQLGEVALEFSTYVVFPPYTL
jgi:hypothetical protein